MGQQDLLIAVVRALEAEGVDYWVTGSTASSMLGEPRTTHDVDIAALLTSDQLPGLAARFPPPRYLFDLTAAQDAVADGEMFNVLDVEAGEKVDFWLLRSLPFQQSCMARRMRHTFLGQPMWVASAEDLILAKLQWSQIAGGSDRQLRDVLSVYQVQRKVIDDAYLDHWAGILDVAADLARVRKEAGSK